MAISFVGLIVIAVVGLAVLFGIAKGVSVIVGLFKAVQAGHATLACPHCGQQTSPVNGRCDACGREL